MSDHAADVQPARRERVFVPLTRPTLGRVGSTNVEARLKSPLADFAMRILPDLGDMTAAVRHLAAAGRLPAAELAELVAPGRSERLYRGLVWMAKMDLVRITPPATEANAKPAR